MSTPISPPPATGAGARELPAYLSNGLMGLRVRELPLASGMALLSGFSGEHPERKIEAAAIAPYPIGGDMAIGGVWLSDVPHQTRNLEQRYDFSCGELTSCFSFDAGGRTADVEVLAFCSRTDPSLVCQEISVEVDGACELSLRASIDARGVAGQAVRHGRTTPGQPDPAVDGFLLWRSQGGLSTCGLAYATELLGSESDPVSRPAFSGQRLTSEYHLKARARRRIRLRQIVSLIPDVLHQAPDQQAVRLAAKARHDGFEEIRRRNSAAWTELWKGRIHLVGAEDRWQALADAAFFYLNSSVHPGSPASTSIFGLATWHDYHYYYGHVMWDIEAFAAPPLCLLQPHAATALLEYRTAMLDGAKRNARLRGRRGLQFPWESAPRSGEEAAPMPGAAAWHEDHVSLDVARAFSVYADITGDLEFLRTKAWPVLRGVAEWLTSRVDRTPSGFDIAGSMGIAERETPVRNAAFTNMGAVVVLRRAIEAAGQLGLPADPSWRRLAESIAIPKRGKAIVSHDDYRINEEKGATPDPLMGLFPFGYPAGADCEQATLDLYLGMAGDYIGSPMLSALYGAWAARRGDRELALKLLDEGYGQFCVGRFMQTLEYRADRFPEQPQAGPFCANIGGFLTSLLFGFTGLAPTSGALETWTERDVVLPAGWRSIEIDRVWIRGEPMRLAARHGARRVELTASDEGIGA
jgi:trehalose/maltose hydrolase-like predicted phosphorylase